MTGRDRSRGQPLVVLAVLLAGWVGVRVAAWNLIPDAEGRRVAAAPAIAGPADQLGPGGSGERQVAMKRPVPVDGGRYAPAGAPVATPTILPPAWVNDPVPLAPGSPKLTLPPAAIPLGASPVPPGEAGQRMAVAGGHQLLWLAAAAMLPLPPEVAARIGGLPASRQNGAATGPASLARWSGDGWLFLRRGDSAATFPRLSGGGTYGASQAGAVLRYRLVPTSPHRPALYLRGAGALNGTREQEVAVGLAARPLAGLPVAAMAELRATRNAQGIAARPAVALVTELPPRRLPLGFTGEAYAQAGYVGGRYATAFVDGLVRAERPVPGLAGLDLRAGGGVWGAKQRGAARLDVGPVASIRLRLGDTASARIEADWRFRVAGKALPGSGPALTLSAGF